MPTHVIGSYPLPRQSLAFGQQAGTPSLEKNPWTAHRALQETPQHADSTKEWPAPKLSKRLFAYRYSLMPAAGLSAMATTTGNSMMRRGLLTGLATLLMGGGLILLDGVLVKAQGIRRIATHEMGHFLLFHKLLAQPDGFLPEVHKVSAADNKGSVEHSYNDPSPQGVATRMLALAGGSEMEKLVYGYPIPMGGLSDRLKSWQLAWLTLGKLLVHSPQEIPAFLRFWWGHGQEAQNLLKRYDPAAVESLTQTLIHDRHWGPYRIQEMLQATGLAHSEPENQQ